MSRMRDLDSELNNLVTINQELTQRALKMQAASTSTLQQPATFPCGQQQLSPQRMPSPVLQGHPQVHYENSFPQEVQGPRYITSPTSTQTFGFNPVQNFQ